VTRPRARAARRSLAIFVDQALSSASNFLLVILVARLLSTSEFGTFAVGFTCLTVSLGVSRANLGVPLSVDLPHETDHTVIDDAIGRSIAVGLVTGAGVGVVVGGLGLLVADGTPLRATLLILGCASPFLVVQDVGRYVAVAQATPGRAVVSDLVWVCTGLAVLGVSAVSHRIGAITAAGGWVLGGLLALGAVRHCLRRPVWRGTWGWFARDRRRHHLTVDALTAAVTPLVVVAVVATVCSPATVGSLRGASTLMSPINVGIAAVGLGAVAEVTRRSQSHARAFMVMVSLGLACCSVLWGAMVWLLPSSVGSFLLGPTWDSARHVLPFSTAEFVGLSVWTGAITLLRAAGRTRVSASFRGLYLVVAVVASSAAAVSLGTAEGVQAALAASAAVLALVSWISALRTPHPEHVVADTPATTT
jgi:O-antigen/teichoic acid export membrane protein